MEDNTPAAQLRLPRPTIEVICYVYLQTTVVGSIPQLSNKVYQNLLPDHFNWQKMFSITEVRAFTLPYIAFSHWQ